MNATLKRTLWLLAISSAIVAVALATGVPRGVQHDAPHGAAHEGTATDEHAMHIDVQSEQDFIASMIPHHQEAVDSARQLLEVTERPEMQALAHDIIEAQTAEIATLETWLAQWYPGAEPDPHYQPMMRDLTSMTPEEADRAFMEDMLLHHDMAIAMARAYLGGEFEKRPEVIAMAEEVVTVQDEENEQMRAWLEEWYGEGADHDGH